MVGKFWSLKIQPMSCFQVNGRYDGKFNEHKLAKLYNSVQDKFDFDSVSTKRRKYKRF